MSWIQITDEEVFPSNSKERTSVAAIKGRDDLGDTVRNVIDTFRDAIQSRGNALGLDGTVPAGFRTYVINLALWLFISTGVARNDGIHTKERENAARKAEELLQAIRDGKTSVELPDGTVTVAARSGTWNSENKLVPRTHPTPKPSTQWQGQNGQYANPEAPPDN